MNQYGNWEIWQNSNALLAVYLKNNELKNKYLRSLGLS